MPVEGNAFWSNGKNKMSIIRLLDSCLRYAIAVGGAIGLGDYLEAGSIAFLFTLADWLESRSSDKVTSFEFSCYTHLPVIRVIRNISVCTDMLKPFYHQMLLKTNPNKMPKTVYTCLGNSEIYTRKVADTFMVQGALSLSMSTCKLWFFFPGSSCYQ